MLSIGEIDKIKMRDGVSDLHLPSKIPPHLISSMSVQNVGNLQEQICAATYPLEPGHPALRVATVAVAEIRITRNEVVLPGCWGENVAWALPVGSFALLKDAGDICCAVEIELVQRVVFHGGAHQPGPFGGFNERAAPDRDLEVAGAGAAIEIMVRSPA